MTGRPYCGVCQHHHCPRTEPHNLVAPEYRRSFQATHARLPTWADATCHMDPSIASRLRAQLGGRWTTNEEETPLFKNTGPNGMLRVF